MGSMRGASRLKISQRSVFILGVRGIPEVQGGMETHVRELAPKLIDQGFDVTVLCRGPYMRKDQEGHWRGVRLVRIWTPRVRILEVVVHTFLGVLYTAWSRPDVLHVHGTGPAAFTPLARLFGLRVVVTHHCLDQNREKWGWIGRNLFRFGEYVGMKTACARIGVSKEITYHIRKRYRVPAHFIPNGVPPARHVETTSRIQRWGLKKGKYILLVARMDPAKRQLDLIRAFGLSDVVGYKLALVGELSEDGYSRSVLNASKEVDGVVLPGYCSGDVLHELFSNAAFFVLPSSLEGLPIALLEALSYGLPCIASDISANQEVGLPSGCYFEVGDLTGLGRKMEAMASSETARCEAASLWHAVGEQYSWGRIGRAVADVYGSIV